LEAPRRRFAAALPPAAIAAVAALVLVRLPGFGIWDPWEVEVADSARRLAEGESVHVAHAGPWLVAQSFRLFGVHEWSGRLPIAVCGVAMIALAYALVARFSDRRSAMYCVLIAGTSPLFLFNARTMLGEAPSLALQTAIALCASMALLHGASSARARAGWLIATLALSAAGVAARGALLCVLPPIGAAALVAAFDGPRETSARGMRIVLGAYALFLTAGIALAVVRDSVAFSAWLGGQPESGQPPSFDAPLEHIFHAFAPWSALLPLALLRLLFDPPGQDVASGSGERNADERRLRLFLLLWAALGYGALTLFMSRYGHKVALVPLVALSAAVALFLRDLERSGGGFWPAAVAALFLALLVLRDFALYPNAPVHGMALSDFTVPTVFNPKREWAAVLLPFAATLVLALGVDPSLPRALDLRSPYRFLRDQWQRGLAFKLWLIALALVLLALEAFGVVSLLPATSKHMATVAIKIGKILMLVPPALPIAVAGVQLALFLYAKLRGLRCAPVLAAGFVVGAYAAQGFMPALSEHFSPREVYESYNELAKPGELLIEYKVGSRAATYYARGAALEVDSLVELAGKLDSDKRRWAVFPAEELANVDRVFRERTKRHLFVADARNDRAMLATNLDIPGRADQSFLSKFVKREAPKISHPLEANFEDEVMLLGYDLKLPHGDYVGAGEHFEITWYFKALHPPGNYRVFVHVDAADLRIHGDHDPVDGKYPVRLWNAGDVIIDTQSLDVPSSYSSGTYTIYLGFYSGDTRLTIKAGPHDDANRVIAGVLRIR
jgi:4-amino-4-deoxy-L-arabinose transferase-like glycosyltransferase